MICPNASKHTISRNQSKPQKKPTTAGNLCPSGNVVSKQTGTEKPLKKASEVLKPEVPLSKARKGKTVVKSTEAQPAKNAARRKENQSLINSQNF